MRRLIAAAAAFTLIAVACGGSDATDFPDDAIAIRVNSDIATGNERLLVAVVEPDGTRLGSPEDEVTIQVAPDDQPSQVQEREATWIWTIPDFAGFYGARFDFDRPGLWRVTVRPAGTDPLETTLIQVLDDACREPGAAAPCAPRVGESAPSMATPTLDEAELADLTTDPDPDERFYRLSLDEALSNGRPSVIVFSTPAYCRTATCGPILDNVKEVAGDHPDVDFVHIEVFTGLRDPDFAPDPAHYAPAMFLWTLPSEPWVFVTDGSGTITARFEGAMSPEELEAEL